MRVSLFLLTFVFTSMSFATNAVDNACNARHVASCDALRQAPADLAGARGFGFPRPKDGTVNYNPAAIFPSSGTMTDASRIRLEEFSVTTRAQRDRAIQIANEVRTSAVAFVKGDVADARLSTTDRNERDQLANRLEKLEIRMAENEDTFCSGTTDLGNPNASYWPQTHTVYLCPAAARGDVASIVRAVSHELGHVTQNCQTTRPLYEVQPGRGEMSDLATCDEEFINRQGGEGSGFVNDKALRRLAEGEVKFIVDDANTDAIRALVRCDIIKEVPRSAIASPRLARETHSCIERSNRALFMDVREAYIESDIRVGGLSRPRAQANVDGHHTEACFARNQEHFADSFAAGLMGFHTKMKKWKATEVRASALLFAAMACTTSEFHDDYSYPRWDLRARVILNEPALARQLGCSTTIPDTTLCPLFLANRSETGASATQTTRPTGGSR